jgi:hypothetical protein
LNPLKVEQRYGQFDRLKHSTPLTMHVLLDETKIIASESQLVDVITSAQRNGSDEVLMTIDPLKKSLA